MCRWGEKGGNFKTRKFFNYPESFWYCLYSRLIFWWTYLPNECRRFKPHCCSFIVTKSGNTVFTTFQSKMECIINCINNFCSESNSIAVNNYWISCPSQLGMERHGFICRIYRSFIQLPFTLFESILKAFAKGIFVQ